MRYGMMMIAAGGGALLAAAPAHATWNVTVEKAGVQNTTATLDTKGTEAFDSLPVGGPSSSTYASKFGGAATGNYSGYSIIAADAYGGAGGTGNYISATNANGTAGNTVSYSLSNLALNNGQSTNYFGMWWSSMGPTDKVTFLKNGSQVFSLTGTDLNNNIVSKQPNSADYSGNPNSQFQGQAKPTVYTYVNFYSDDSFDAVDFSESNKENFESDNHTVGHYTAGAVPEPATWAMMLGGFGLVGSALRRRQPGLAALA